MSAPPSSCPAATAESAACIALPFEAGFRPEANARRGFRLRDVYHLDAAAGPLAGGGFGTVYRCHHLFVPDMPAAAKRVRLRVRPSGGGGADDDDAWSGGEDADAAHQRMLLSVEEQLAEVAILKLFRDSPYIVHLHEYFLETDGAPAAVTSLYIVTELLRGGELFHCIARRNQRGRRFSERDARDIFAVLLQAIRFMHSRRVIHRDIKPSNLLLQVEDEPTSLKVSDFGQSTRLHGAGDTARTCTGTPGYRPPEMYLRQPYDERSDLFSAGVVLFLLLAGYQPFASYPQHRIEAQTVRCEFRENEESWDRVSLPAKRLVKRLLTRAEHRLRVEEAQRHDWMRTGRDEAADLTENAKEISKWIQEEERLKRESLAAARQRPMTQREEPEPPHGSHPSAESDGLLTSLQSESLFRRLQNSEVLHVGPDLPPATTPLLSHIGEAFTAATYTEAVARRYCRRLLECVAALHECGVVHRGITPTSLLVRAPDDDDDDDDDGGERVVLRHSPFTAAGLRHTGYCGTPYRSTAPEVYTAFSYDAKVDLWGVGVVAYLLLCGVDPFHGAPEDVETRRRGAAVDYPFSLDAPSRAARAFVDQLLQPEPSERPAARQALGHAWMRAEEASLASVHLEFAFGGLRDWQ